MIKKEYQNGLLRGIPIAVGYLSVSFGFGAMAAAHGIRALDAALISMTNFTSAGQFAGLTMILENAHLWEIVMTLLIINSRYALMGVALSQRFGEGVGLLPRFLLSFFNTDETFALAMSRKEKLTIPFFLGLGTLPWLGWAAGTLMGALAGSVLPLSVRTALGVMLYGMFIAIVVPPARKEKPVLAVCLMALVLSCCFQWVPGLKTLSTGVTIVICTVAASAAAAWLFPVPDEEVAR